MDTLRVLVIEDDEDVAANLSEYLEPRGFVMDFAYNGLNGVHLAVTGTYDVIVLDLMLPGMDGITVCERLRGDASLATPILMLTAKDGLPDKLRGFEAGADDYLVKPFALPELHHRLKALVRRGRAPVDEIRIADLVVDPVGLTASRGGRRLELNGLDFRLLLELARESPRVVPRAELERRLWAEDVPSSEVLRAHVYRLRREVDRPFPRPLIRTVHGVGYALAPPGEDPPPDA